MGCSMGCYFVMVKQDMRCLVGCFFCIYKESMENSVGYFFAVFPEVEGGYRMLFSVTREGRVWGVGYGARVSDRTQHIQR